MPLGFAEPEDRPRGLTWSAVDPDEYLLYPKGDTDRPMDSGHRAPLVQDLPRSGPGCRTSMKTHEMRHSAADNLWRETGNLILAQQLLRHESPATTAGYLHPTREDLDAALRPSMTPASVAFDEDDSAKRCGIAPATHDNQRTVAFGCH